MPKVIDMFCGGGGMGLAFQLEGYEIPLAFDFDKFCVETYRANVGDHVKQIDITKLTAMELPYADVWTFGFPCQDLSIAGKQAGLFEGKRSGLFFEVMRLLDESTGRPKMLLAENVKGLKPYLPVLEQEFKARGYRMYVNVFNSKYWDVPQNRERYYVVGVRDDVAGDFVYPTEQHESVPKLSTVLETDVAEKYYISDEKAEKILEQALLKLDKLGTVHSTITPDRVDKKQNGRRAKADDEEMYTLTAQDLHGVILRWRNSTDGLVPSDTAPTLKANAHKAGERNTPFVIEEPRINVVGILDQPGHEHRKRVHDPEGLSPTVTAVAGGDQQVKILEPLLVPVGDTAASALMHSRGLETRKDSVCHCVKGAEGGSSKGHLVERTVTGYRVRRLTPTEYGRLQGFPMDTWKQVVSNSQAYKQFGNAVTVTVARAMAKTIKEFLGEGLRGETRQHVPAIEDISGVNPQP